MHSGTLLLDKGKISMNKQARLDPRLNAFRGDLADKRLQGLIHVSRFTDGHERQIVHPVADIHQQANEKSAMTSQLLYGQKVQVFEEADGWLWVQSLDDGYVGYIKQKLVGEIDKGATHRVVQPRTFIYFDSDLRSPVKYCLSLGSLVCVEGRVDVRGNAYALLADGGAIIMNHVKPIASVATDYVKVAETLVATPYRWGGVSAFGIDCSGLVQLAMRICGRLVLRDSDMQLATLGRDLAGPEFLKKGDLIFWRGHVAIMVDNQNIIHANGASMDVRIEPLAVATERLAQCHNQPLGFKRPF